MSFLAVFLSHPSLLSSGQRLTSSSDYSVPGLLLQLASPNISKLLFQASSTGFWTRWRDSNDTLLWFQKWFYSLIAVAQNPKHTILRRKSLFWLTVCRGFSPVFSADCKAALYSRGAWQRRNSLWHAAGSRDEGGGRGIHPFKLCFNQALPPISYCD